MATFELFRYQLLPASQEHQQDLFGESLTLDQIKEKKNEIFWELLQEGALFNSEKLLQKTLFSEGYWFSIKLAPKRKTVINKPDFRSESVENWPHITVFINNDPAVQIIGVSRNQRAFKDSISVVRTLEKRIGKPLKDRGLTVQFQSIYEQTEFWQLMQQQRGRVERVRFEMISPNMANISGVLKVDLRRLNQESNSQKTTLELEAVAGSALQIDQSDGLISSCVDYSANGGGDIKVKIKGFKKIIRTSTSVRTIEADEIIFEDTNCESLDLLLKGVLK
ncbi:hypothetical protein MCEMAEM4_03403 [Burkholderiaceae bacterium]